ncbi:MAG: pitrilysin family protein [Myxococcota bacterium]
MSRRANERRAASTFLRGRAGLLAFGLLAATVPIAGAAADCRPLALDPLLASLVPTLEAEQLNNGLRVILAPRPEARSVTLSLSYDVGSRDDPAGRSGLAHFLEHMMFKGSQSIADGEHFRRVQDVGGRVNAFTDWDATRYVETVPPAALRRVLESEADRMRGLRLLADHVETQRAAIQEEEALRIDNVPYARAASKFLARLWKGTPYARSPTGTDADRDATTLEDLARFHADHLSPDGAVLVIVGRFEPAQARALVADLFGSIESRPTGPARPAFEVDRAPLAASLDDALAPFPVYGLAWHASGAQDPDALALAVVDDLLLGTRDARFARALRGELVFDAYSLSFALRDAGLLNFVFVPRTFASFRRIRRELDHVVDDLRTHGPDDDELCRAIRHEQLDRLAAAESHEGLADALARGALFADDPRRFETELRALGALTRDDVQRAAERALGREPSTFVIMPTGVMRWLKPVLEFLPDGVGASLEESLL